MELIIRTVDKQPLVAVASEIASQRGDVIAIVENGWQWSEAERNNPDWLIIKCELIESEVEALLESGRLGEPQWRRRIGINTDGLVAGETLLKEQLFSRAF